MVPRPAVFACAVLLLTGCLDYELGAGEDPTPPQDDDDDDSTEAPGVDDPIPEGIPVELCDGVDNDGDGLVDEGYPDGDLDGIADCVDESSDPDLPDAAYVTPDPSCTIPLGPASGDPWQLAVEWTFDLSAHGGSNAYPAVGQLTDDDGDGAITAADQPDIVVITHDGSSLYALHGDGSGTVFELHSGFGKYAGATIADVDQDGEPEVVTPDEGLRLVAFDAGGAVDWVSPPGLVDYAFNNATVADLEGDGDIEIIVADWIVDGATGSVVGYLTPWSCLYPPAVADLDADGVQEFLCPSVGAHAPDGTLIWASGCAQTFGFTAVAELDGDPQGELFEVCDPELFVYDHDGSVLAQSVLPFDQATHAEPGPPAVADFDGDGEVELAVPVNDTFSLWNPDGTMVWSRPIEDPSGFSGCAGADLNGDGVYEIVYADEVALYILDGPTGEILARWDDRESVTGIDYPVVADVDGDGSAEIVVVSNQGAFQGLAVLGHPDDGWPTTQRAWNVHDYAPHRMGADGWVPSPAPLYWTLDNVYRAHPAAGGVPDLVPFV